jgi:hypothetical protein
MKKLALGVSLTVIGLGSVAWAADSPVHAHASATCSDLANQAAAQRAANTRDADHDGIYCEDLPCPCLKSGSGGSQNTSSTSPSRSSGGLGRSVTLGPWTKRDHCHLRGPLPDAGCTPGARFRRVTRARVCTPGYAKRVRNVPQSRKDAVYAAYGIKRHFNGRDGEVDHLVSLELGGSNSTANLFPEAASPTPGSHEKDRLETRLHSDVCSRQISLRKAQHLIARDWVAAYHARFG